MFEWKKPVFELFRLYRPAYKFHKLSLMEFAKLIVVKKENFEASNYLL